MRSELSKLLPHPYHTLNPPEQSKQVQVKSITKMEKNISAKTTIACSDSSLRKEPGICQSYWHQESIQFSAQLLNPSKEKINKFSM